MAWRAVTLLALAALASPATSAAPSATWPATSSEPGPFLGIVFEGPGWKLARIDPVSLEATGKSIFLGRSSVSWAFAPDRSLLAIAAETSRVTGIVRVVDTSSLRQRTPLRLSAPGPVAWPVANPAPRALVDRGHGQARRRLLRPARPPARAESSHRRALLRAARTPLGFALLLGPKDGFGQARLAVVDANGAVRSTKLDIVAGWQRPDGEPYVVRHRMPGLAVDPEGGRAFVVSPESRVLEVDLSTLVVREHDVSQAVSLLGRLRDWLEPAAQAKASEGPVRSARWLGNGLLAVSGTDSHATVRAGRIERQVWTPAGLRLIDTRTWSARTIDGRASDSVFADGLLLATGSSYDSASSARSTIGLVGYSPDGDARFALFPNRYPWVSAVVNARAYVGFGGGPDQTLSIVDLATGEVVGERKGIVPQLLLGAADPWWG